MASKRGAITAGPGLNLRLEPSGLTRWLRGYFGQYYHHKERCYSIGEIMKTFTAVFYRKEDMYVAECPEVGTVSQGRAVEEAVANLKEATELYLEEFPLEDGRRPIIGSVL
jgi:predicted RNase H-like HicB family nuclease